MIFFELTNCVNSRQLSSGQEFQGKRLNSCWSKRFFLTSWKLFLEKADSSFFQVHAFEKEVEEVQEMVQRRETFPTGVI